MSRADSNSIEVARQIPSASAQPHVNLGAMTTYRVSGEASLWLRILKRSIQSLRCQNEPNYLFLLLVGINLLIADEGFKGIVVSWGQISPIATLTRVPVKLMWEG